MTNPAVRSFQKNEAIKTILTMIVSITQVTLPQISLVKSWKKYPNENNTLANKWAIPSPMATTWLESVL